MARTCCANDIVSNRWIWGALVIRTVLLPPLARGLRVEAPSTDGWMLIAGMSAAPVVVGQVVRPWRKPADARE
jgi:hypothetical protein